MNDLVCLFDDIVHIFPVSHLSHRQEFKISDLFGSESFCDKKYLQQEFFRFVEIGHSGNFFTIYDESHLLRLICQIKNHCNKTDGEKIMIVRFFLVSDCVRE